MVGSAPKTNVARWVSRLIGTVVGLLLITTAGMKLYDLLYGQAAALLWLPSPRWILAAVEIETLIGLWLLSGWQATWAWRISLMLFAGLAAISAYLGMTGQSSCGCLGRVELNPWWMFAIDLVTLTVLFVFRPLRQETISAWPWLRQGILSVAGAVLLLGFTSAVILLSGASPTKVLAQLRGDTLLVDPLVYDAGSGSPGELRTITIQLINDGDKSVRVEGGISTCACVTTDDLPVTIAPGEKQSLSIRIKFTGSTGRFQQRYLLYTDDKNRPMIIARFTGAVTSTDTLPIANAIERQ